MEQYQPQQQQLLNLFENVRQQIFLILNNQTLVAINAAHIINDLTKHSLIGGLGEMLNHHANQIRAEALLFSYIPTQEFDNIKKSIIENFNLDFIQPTIVQKNSMQWTFPNIMLAVQQLKALQMISENNLKQLKNLPQQSDLVIINNCTQKEIITRAKNIFNHFSLQINYICKQIESQNENITKKTEYHES